jgi:hypothetical protein
MSIKKFSLAILTGITFFSCAQKDKTDEVDESLFGPAPAKAVQPAADSLNAKTIAMPPPVALPAATGNPAAGRTGVMQQNMPVQPAMQPVVAQPNTAGLNPAHGQPGHRCDISVGAPLNSKPAAQNASPVAVNSSPAPAITAVAPAVNQQVTAPGMNPPHGQPGHRCDISVGAPLNSKPAVAATPAPVAVTPLVNASDSVKH